MRLWTGRQPVALKIWNTLDLADFPQLHTSYYADAKGVLLAYSVTDQKSFAEILTWAAIARREVPEATVVLVGTKIDQRKLREVSFCEGIALANSLEIPFLETSSKDAININEVFLLLTKLILSKPGVKVVRMMDAPLLQRATASLSH